MFRRKQPEIRLALILALVVLLCLVVAGIGADEAWGRFLGGMSDSMPLTILTLVWGSRRLKKRRESPFASRGSFPERWAPAFVLLTGLLGLISTHFTYAWDRRELLGALIGVTVTVLLWAAVDPVARNGQALNPQSL